MDETFEIQQASDEGTSPGFGLGAQEALEYRRQLRGMIGVASKVPLKDRSVLSLVYTPGVAAPCLEIAQAPLSSFDYTMRGNTIALVSDGSSAFGLGNIGPLAALPMLEDACIVFKTFGGIDAFPISLNTHNVEEIITTCMALRPTFGGICLSSITSPRCFTVADHLARALNLPSLHAEQHATAAAILGGLYNALKIVDAPNLITNALILPGIFRGAMDVRATGINQKMLIAAAQAIADLVPSARLSAQYIVPSVMDYSIAPRVARAVAEAARQSGIALEEKSPAEIEAHARATIYEGHRPVPAPSHHALTLDEQALELHRRYQGLLEIRPKMPVIDTSVLNSFYLSPGIPEATRQILTRTDAIYDYTGKSNRIAIVIDGSAVLGLGNIGPRAALPVMEGKAILFQTFAGIEAYPICLATQDVDEIVAAVEHIAPAFGGVNLEDISAQRCFEVEKRLQDALTIPIFHDDQHGTATVTLAGLMNALRLVGKYKQDVTAVLMGPGAAGVAVSRMLLAWGIGSLLLVNRGGILRPGRTNLNPFQLELASKTNPEDRSGTLADALVGADIFIGVSGPGMLTQEMVQTMAPQAIVFALTNPVPEITPEEALAGGARVVATGRSDYPNQVNNSLAFPGLMRGALDVRAHVINDAMKLAAAERLASLLSEQELEEGQIIPLAMNYDVAPALAAAVAQAAMEVEWHACKSTRKSWPSIAMISSMKVEWHRSLPSKILVFPMLRW